MSKYIDKNKVLEYIIFGVVGKDITCRDLTRGIESLPTIEVSDDCINRQQVIEVVHKHFIDAMDKTPHEIDEDGYDVYTDMKAVNELLKHNKHISKAIKALPPVTPTERTGEWIIKKRDPQDVYEHAYCSECNAYWSSPILVDSFNYCPICGAKMKDGTENE